MTVDSLNTALSIIFFILPGFVIKGVVDSLTPAKRISETKDILTFLVYSLVNCGVWSWVYLLIFPLIADNIHYWLLIWGVSLIGALIISIPIGLIKQKMLFVRMARHFHLRAFNPIQTAWDRLFSKQKTYFALITLVDDSEVLGIFGKNSVASSDPEDRDLFICTVLKKTEDGMCEIDTDSEGIYIPKNMIRHIEFKKLN